MRYHRSNVVLFLVCGLALVACENPAANTIAAKVEEAKAAPTTAPTAGGLALTPATSSIGFVGSKITGSHEGKFHAFTGSLVLDEAAPEKSSVSIEIDMASFSTGNGKLDGHLKSPDFFDVGKFPKATFVSTRITKGGASGASHTVVGNLTLHGVTKGISFPAKVNIAPAQVSVAAEFAINRKDFGIVYPGMPDDLIRDEVVIKLDLKAARK